MRERSFSLVLVSVVAVLPAGVSAQSSQSAQGARSGHEAEMSALRAHIDSLMPRVRALNVRDSVRGDSVEQVEAKKGKPDPLDSLQLGPFKILGSHSVISRSAKDATAAWEGLAPLFAGAEEDAQRAKIIPEIAGVSRNVAVRITPSDAIASLLPDHQDLWQYAYERAMGLVLTRRLPASVRGWLMGEGIATAQNLDWVYRAIALPIPLAEKDRKVITGTCFDGDIRDCRSLLGIEAPFHPTSDPMLRASFITYIAKHAPAGGVAKSTADSSVLIPALEHIGGAPVDQLIGDWRGYVLSERPRGFADFGRAQASVLFWIVVCAALATRSTRWRLG
jgi:hypothetical protein